ncbi:MAG: hypothetical protein HYV17_03805 [Xanthomonadales bacterium]|nr:hypothetical protein [Xanthomonadales bacterium]
MARLPAITLAVIGCPADNSADGSTRRLWTLWVRITNGCASVVPRKLVPGLLPASPVLLQQAPISGADTALLRPGSRLNTCAPTSRTATSSHASFDFASGASKRASKRPSRTATSGRTSAAISGGPACSPA